jgi:hypothetical protein
MHGRKRQVIVGSVSVSKRITIAAGGLQIGAEVDDTPTAEAIAAVLAAGELAYWPPGKMFCIFFGATPASREGEIRAASPVNIMGRVRGDLEALWQVADGATVVVAPASERA